MSDSAPPDPLVIGLIATRPSQRGAVLQRSAPVTDGRSGPVCLKFTHGQTTYRQAPSQPRSRGQSGSDHRLRWP